MANICRLYFRVDGDEEDVWSFVYEHARAMNEYDLPLLQLDLRSYGVFDSGNFKSEASADGRIRTVHFYGNCRWAPDTDAMSVFGKRYPNLIFNIDYEELGNDILGRITINEDMLLDDDMMHTYDPPLTDDGEFDYDADYCALDDFPALEPVPESDIRHYRSKLISAIRSGDIETAKALALTPEHSASLKKPTASRRWLPLHWAIHRGDQELIETLLKTSVLSEKAKRMAFRMARYRGFASMDLAPLRLLCRFASESDLVESIDVATWLDMTKSDKEKTPVKFNQTIEIFTRLLISEAIDSPAIKQAMLLNSSARYYIRKHLPELFDSIENANVDNLLNGELLFECMRRDDIGFLGSLNLEINVPQTKDYSIDPVRIIEESISRQSEFLVKLFVLSPEYFSDLSEIIPKDNHKTLDALMLLNNQAVAIRAAEGCMSEPKTARRLRL